MGCWLSRFGSLGCAHFLRSGLSPLFCWIWLSSQSKATSRVAEVCSPPLVLHAPLKRCKTLQGQSWPQITDTKHALARSLLVLCRQNVMENEAGRGVLARTLFFFFLQSVEPLQENLPWLSRSFFSSSESQHNVLKSQRISHSWQLDGISRCWDETMQRSIDYLINIYIDPKWSQRKKVFYLMRTLQCCSLLPQEMCLPMSTGQIKSTIYRKDPSFSSAAAETPEWSCSPLRHQKNLSGIKLHVHIAPLGQLFRRGLCMIP